MRSIRRKSSGRVDRSAGQSLIETVLIMPVLLAIVLNAINFGYVFLMALNITSSARTSTLYSITGDETPAGIPVPAAGPISATNSVSHLAYQDLTGAVFSPSSNAGVQVCSPSVGTANAGTVNQKSQCSSFGSIGSFPDSQPDPELNSGNTMPAFMLNRVDVGYQFTTPIPLMPFNIVVLANGACTSSASIVTCTFYRHSVMRVMR
jgi:Flp pilus assembly protein TadG